MSQRSGPEYDKAVSRGRAGAAAWREAGSPAKVIMAHVGRRDAEAALDSAAHGGARAAPVLWILDPFDYSSVPFSLVKACLAAPRDEVLITWFADEIYRFSGDPSKEDAIDAHFGSRSWQRSRRVGGEAARKEELLGIYRNGLESIPRVHTGAFSISSKNETARYSLVLAKHSDWPSPRVSSNDPGCALRPACAAACPRPCACRAARLASSGLQRGHRRGASPSKSSIRVT